MLISETLHLRLRCLLKYPLRVFGSKSMKPPMKQENKHSTYFRVLVFVFKQLLRDSSGGQASRSRQNLTLLELRQINIDMEAINNGQGTP